MCNELALNNGTDEQINYRYIGDSVAAAKVMLIDLESLVGNLYLAKKAAKEVIARAGTEALPAYCK